ncbi:MAG: hypothetical protein ACRC3B_19410, partial [Bacteroidia bacterium]
LLCIAARSGGGYSEQRMSDSGKTPYNHTHGYLTERPRLITVLCVIHYIWTLIGFAGVLSPKVKHAGLYYPPLIGLVISLQFIALIGIWNRKRWGVHIYTYSVILYTLLQILLDRTDFLGLDIFLALCLIGTCMFFYKRMDKNL